ncbi:acyltransferase [Pseudomonas sp. 2995-3]|jgi:peptidoglycan/LPS O-acetylase OafA/YrhL|uniref:acyltransferase family protein n=1 Tax=Pseudomonas sp. 2995-3 TaxID=1712680 RepID=UPI000C14BFB0|nr:acyltransferase [Pseudomonas sp. 2995-3]PIB65190.1 acyltransferase [Pseudomonas sp. 2995-3]
MTTIKSCYASSLTTAPSSDKLEFIQALRGFAALIVVIFHGSRFISPYGTGLGDQLFGEMGSLGVSVFFIISGIIMTITTTKSDGSVSYVKEFLIKRFSRVWPAYIIASLAFVFIVRYGFDFFSDPTHLRSLFYSLVFLPPSGSDGAPVFGFPVLSVGWSLSYEMYFYIVFGLSMLFGRARWIAFFSWIGLTLLLIPYLHGAVTLSTTTNYGFSHVYLNLITSPIIWLFAVGVMIGLVYKSRIEIKSVNTLQLLIFTAFSLVIWQYLARFKMGHGISEWGLSLIPMMLILMIASKRINLSVPGWTIFLGDISFSLYLWHPFVQEYLPNLMTKMGYGNFTNGFSFLFLTTLASILLATASYKLLERGLSEYIKHSLLKKKLSREGSVPGNVPLKPYSL